MTTKWLSAGLLAAVGSFTAPALAVSSAELYQTQTYTYGRFEARVRFAPGDGVVSSFFLWKPGSEVAGTYWNELDFEKLGADCRMQTNPLYGLPLVDRGRIESVDGDLCGEYHTYAFEWTPSYIAWLIDGVEVRREEGETAAAFAQNAASGMRIHFNVWPGDITFGGNFDPAILPVQQYIAWVQYSSFDGAGFVLEWTEDFAGPSLPAGWALGNWASPKGYSTHAPANAGFVDGVSVLSLTADDATGFVGTPPPDDAVEPPPDDGAGGAAGASGAPGATAGDGPGAGAGADNGAASPGGTGNAGGNAPSDGAPSGVAGAVSIPGSAGGAAAPAPGARAGSDGGCSVGAGARGAAPFSAGLVLAAFGLALRRGRGRRKRHAGAPPARR